MDEKYELGFRVLKKPVVDSDLKKHFGYDGNSYLLFDWKCPSCEASYNSVGLDGFVERYLYCPWCGQAIDWGSFGDCPYDEQLVTEKDWKRIRKIEDLTSVLEYRAGIGDQTIPWKVEDVKLKNGANLYRTINRIGEPWSLIEVGGIEMWSCKTSEEDQMVKAWNGNG